MNIVKGFFYETIKTPYILLKLQVGTKHVISQRKIGTVPQRNSDFSDAHIR